MKTVAYLLLTSVFLGVLPRAQAASYFELLPGCYKTIKFDGITLPSDGRTGRIEFQAKSDFLKEKKAGDFPVLSFRLIRSDLTADNGKIVMPAIMTFEAKASALGSSWNYDHADEYSYRYGNGFTVEVEQTMDVTPLGSDKYLISYSTYTKANNETVTDAGLLEIEKVTCGTPIRSSQTKRAGE